MLLYDNRILSRKDIILDFLKLKEAWKLYDGKVANRSIVANE